jgi:hypothetical protein
MSPTPLELLLSGRFAELLELLDHPSQRSRLLAEAAGRVGTAPPVLQQRQLNAFAAGDWSWGLLSAAQRRGYLARDARLLSGAGHADSGAAQAAALKRLREELGHLYGELDLALRTGDLAWLLPLAEHLVDLLEISGGAAALRERYSALLAAGQRLGSTELTLHARLGLATAHMNSGSFAEAALEAQRAARLARRLRQRKLLAAALHLEGSALAMQGEHSKARERLTAALELRRRLREPRAAIATLGSLAYVEQCQGATAAAQGYLEEALSGCRALGDRRGEAMLLQNLAVLAYSEGRLAACQTLAGQALAHFTALADRPGRAGALSSLGYSAYGQADFAAAQQYQEQALELSRELGDSYRESAARLALGALTALQEQTAASRLQFERALELCRAGGDSAGVARALCGLANLAPADEAAKAASRLAEAAGIFSVSGDAGGCVDSLLYAGALLARSATGSAAALQQLEPAALLLAGAQQQATALRHGFDPLDLRLLGSAQQCLASAQATAMLSAARQASLAEAAASLDLEQLMLELDSALTGVLQTPDK